MTTQHTPGPWTNDPADGALVDARVNGRLVAIAEVFHCDTDESREANARLIAAAPDLLAALEQVMGCITGDNIERIHLPVYLDNARAAIRKAKGDHNG